MPETQEAKPLLSDEQIEEVLITNFHELDAISDGFLSRLKETIRYLRAELRAQGIKTLPPEKPFEVLSKDAVLGMDLDELRTHTFKLQGQAQDLFVEHDKAKALYLLEVSKSDLLKTKVHEIQNPVSMNDGGCSKTPAGEMVEAIEDVVKGHAERKAELNGDERPRIEGKEFNAQVLIDQRSTAAPTATGGYGQSRPEEKEHDHPAHDNKPELPAHIKAMQTKPAANGCCDSPGGCGCSK